MLDVRFKNQGLDSIEVQDNGDGISPHNYETLALKHHTSKLSTYSDLTTLQTFGFRGEALSSLCALSRFSVVTCMAPDAPKGSKLEFEISGKLKGITVVSAQKGTTVVVENLFNNLPVRRRELERNIKREWGRVTGLLGQYACIQTGIKFSVTQQAGKGNKTTVISTKGNPTTRENIVNVFGAKTLTALVPLNLNLELEPTSAPSQRWSTQEDGGKKDIRILGYISRPVSGEGRQTPDRQMFFVNSRPCGLAQISKAFNEVYKSYNGIQSPFIFANIELDTHLYDVNVSPDKRTILLHDQTRMLENLKTALTALFESQDYTVPISQLPAQKQPQHRQLTISRENRVPSKTPQALTESTEGTESEDGSRSSRRERSTDDETAQKPYNPNFRCGAVSRDSLSRDREAVSLISNWVGRKAEDRVEKDPPPPKAPSEASDSLSRDQKKFVAKLERESEQAQVSRDSSNDPESSVATSQGSHTPPYKPPIPVADFNQRMAEFQKQKGQSTQNSTPVDPEPQIQALLSPTKSPSLSSIFTSSVRSQRPPAEIATITIGDHTVTSSIGTPYPKWPRNENISSINRAAKPPAAPMPSFGSRLSQRFAAPRTTQQHISNGEGDSDNETQDPPLFPPLFGSPRQSVDGAGDEEHVLKPASSAAAVKQELDSSFPTSAVEEDDDYVDDEEKKAREEVKIQEMIKETEDAAILPSEESAMRAKSLFKGGARKKDSTVSLVRSLDTSTAKIAEQVNALGDSLSAYQLSTTLKTEHEALDSERAEEKLSLTISKSDFAKMKIIGQFNLGFILASRASEPNEDGLATADDLFIIDQHASDEKYNFERLQATTIVQSQRLVYPKTLDLTALEEEIVIENLPALETNGFVVTVDQSGEAEVGKRCQLISLPLSRETTFNVTDLEELLVLLSEHPPRPVPRPSKVRKMFAMRACRSSIMIGKTLTQKQMRKVVKHMGEIDKPWNCPHGRPTMRHLCGLGVWDELGWKEGDAPDGGKRGATDWATYVRQKRDDSTSP
jgi:DNA mismatch repair protein PMS2